MFMVYDDQSQRSHFSVNSLTKKKHISWATETNF